MSPEMTGFADLVALPFLKTSFPLMDEVREDDMETDSDSRPNMLLNPGVYSMVFSSEKYRGSPEENTSKEGLEPRF
jgi:hypothetical protein